MELDYPDLDDEASQVAKMSNNVHDMIEVEALSRLCNNLSITDDEVHEGNDEERCE